MCGISGIITAGYKAEHTDLLKKSLTGMTDRIASRGPDAEGFWYSWEDEYAKGLPAACLGHRRLSVIDLTETGSQPMTSHDGNLVMVYNGEIYNAAELKERLLKEGYVSEFRGTSDSEILLESIRAYGICNALKACTGMFAIAVYDKRTGRLMLARDRIGEKPLYYGFCAEKRIFAFASDAACFCEIYGFDNEINRDILPVYLIHGYIPAPYTIYKDIWKLEPGTILTIDPGYDYFDPQRELDQMEREGLTEHTAGTHRYEVYYSLREVVRYGQEHPFKGSREEAASELERLLSLAIRGQMISDVPLGAFLSAGIDSSTVVSLMQAQAPGRVKTFTIGMEDEAYNEAGYAAEIARFLGTEHTELMITEKDAMSVVPLLPKMFGEPFSDSSQIPTYLVSRMTRDHVTVSLSGDGGDELFCGYTSYDSIYRIWNKIRNMPLPFRHTAGSVASTVFRGTGVVSAKSRLISAKNPIDLHRIEQETDPSIRDLTRGTVNEKDVPPWKLVQLSDEIKSIFPSRAGTDPRRAVMYADMKMYHPDDILVKVDRTAMAVSLETRVPMLDRDVVSFAHSLPMEYLNNNGTGKSVLRDVLYRHVPRELMDRPKKGFSIPIDKWLLTGELREYAQTHLDRTKIEKEGYLNAKAVCRMWDDYVSRGKWRVQLWYLLMFEAWLDK